MKIFVKIFLWYWAAMILSSIMILVLTLTIGPIAQHRKKVVEDQNQILSQFLTLYGNSAISALNEGGQAELDKFTRSMNWPASVSIHVFDDGEKQIAGKAPLQPVLDLATRANKSGNTESMLLGKSFIQGMALTGPDGKKYILVAEWPTLSPSLRRGPWYSLTHRFGMRVAVSIFIAGIISSLLAWQLTSPIRQLRQTAHRLGQGDLAARVGDKLGAKRGELADLGQDFDRMAERIENLVNSQQRLLRDISHELRSPLARLNVALELARLNCPWENAVEPLNRIERETERLDDLIGRLRTLTQVETGLEEIEKKRIGLHLIVQDIVNDANFELVKKNRSVKVISYVPIMVSGSEELLRQAIENVVRNAAHYTREGTQVEITIKAEHNPGSALVRVRDHGPGVPDEDLSKIFQPFYRIADARERLTGGTGIGLAITERAIKMHQGSVTAANHEAGGLLVEIRLPLA